jgi:hypothetical protein
VKEAHAMPSLHDATLVRVIYSWADAACQLVVTPVGANGKEHALSLIGVTQLNIPHAMPWGPSVSIDDVKVEGGALKIEMQSGDVIKARAKEVTYGVL